MTTNQTPSRQQTQNPNRTARRLAEMSDESLQNIIDHEHYWMADHAEQNRRSLVVGLCRAELARRATR